MRNKLEELNHLLKNSPDSFYCEGIENALAGNDETLRQYLSSNDLWGGSGSIADQAGLENHDPNIRIEIEELLISLGEEQIQEGIVNVRTETWVTAFKSRSGSGT